MFYLLKKKGSYDDYNIKIRSNKDYEKYFAKFDESLEIRKWLFDMDFGRKPYETSYTFKFSSKGKEEDIRKLDFLSNGTTFNLVSARVSDFFQTHYPDSVRFLTTSIQTADAVIDDYKIMTFTVWDNSLYDPEKSRFSMVMDQKYLRFPRYYSDCLQGRPIVVNANKSCDVLVSNEVASRLKEQGFVLLGLSEPFIVERT